jgi:hypothetical protein
MSTHLFLSGATMNAFANDGRSESGEVKPNIGGPRHTPLR